MRINGFPDLGCRPVGPVVDLIAAYFCTSVDRPQDRSEKDKGLFSISKGSLERQSRKFPLMMFAHVENNEVAY